ncbi:MAG: oligosaccharide flippase family protein [Acidimicrobiia bacterium]
MSLRSLGTTFGLVARNATSRSLGAVVNLLTGAATGIMVARHLGPAGFGQFSVVWAATWALAPLVSVGLDRLLVREIPRNIGIVDLRRGLRVAAIMGPLAGAGLLLATWWIGASQEVLLATACAGLYLATSGLVVTLDAVFSASERMGLGTVVQVVESVAALAGVVAVIMSGGGLVPISIALTAGRLAHLLVSAVVVHSSRGLTTRPMNLEAPPLSHLIRTSMPIAGSRTLSEGIARSDVVLLGLLVAPSDVGLYSATVVVSLYIPQLLREYDQALFPALARARSLTHSGLAVVFRQTWRAYLVVAVAAAAGLAVLAPEVLELLYDSSFVSAAPILVILTATVPLRLLAGLCATTLDATNRQVTRMAVTAVALATKLVLVPLLVILFGIAGAAVASVVAELVLLAGMLVPFRGLWPLRWGHTAEAIVIGATVAAVAFLTPGHVLVRIAAGVGIFAVLAALIWRRASDAPTEGGAV